MTADQFVEFYCSNSEINEKEFYEELVPMPDPVSPTGWAAIPRDPLQIYMHVKLYLS